MDSWVGSSINISVKEFGELQSAKLLHLSKKSSTVTLLPIWWPDNQMHHFDLPLPPHRLSPLALHTCLRHVRLSWLHLFLPPSVLGRFLHLLMSRFFLLCPGHPRSKNRQLKVQTSKPILIALHGFKKTPFLALHESISTASGESIKANSIAESISDSILWNTVTFQSLRRIIKSFQRVTQITRSSSTFLHFCFAFAFAVASCPCIEGGAGKGGGEKLWIALRGQDPLHHENCLLNTPSSQFCKYIRT